MESSIFRHNSSKYLEFNIIYASQNLFLMITISIARFITGGGGTTKLPTTKLYLYTNLVKCAASGQSLATAHTILDKEL